jgi:hypothetical protein
MSNAEQPESPRPGRPPLVRLAKGQEVSLGCGTLILIGIIVAIFSGNTKSEVNEMNQRLERIERKLDEVGKIVGKILPPEKR